MLCQFKYAYGSHVLNMPLKLECSHSVCLKCCFESIGQVFEDDDSCCIESLKNIKIEDLLENYKHEADNGVLLTKEFCQSLHQALSLSTHQTLDNSTYDVFLFTI